MRILQFIVSLLILSLLSGGGESVSSDPQHQACRCVSVGTSRDSARCGAQNRDICLSVGQGYSFSGHEEGSHVSVRLTGRTRSSSSHTKSAFRIVKSGKLIDNNSHPYLTMPFNTLSGTQTAERYLYSICCLRL
ncbi:MAG: hypothetical protein ACI4AE_02040 [Candidatus Cryptobacteroides sp.]